MKTALSLVLTVSAFALLSPTEAAIVRVPADQNTIQAGIDAAESGDTILVAHGTYRENIVIRERPLVLGSLFLMNGDSLEADSTILEPVEAGSVVILSENCGASVLAGFTVRHGTGTIIEGDWGEFMAGGGVLVLSGAPVIRNCNIRDNRVEHWDASGGGIYAKADSVSILNCCIRDNFLIGDDDRFVRGAGIYLDSLPSAVESCRVLENNTDGIYCAWGVATIRNCIIEGSGYVGVRFHSNPFRLISTKVRSNSLGIVAWFYRESGLIDSCEVNMNGGERYTAGGIDLENGSCTISNSYIHNNGEGGIKGRYMSFDIVNCRIIGNSGYQGAGIALYVCGDYVDRNRVRISNCIITGNRATRGGGLYCTSSSPVVTRTLISGNSGGEAGGVLALGNNNTTFINCTVHGNAGREMDFEGGPHVIANSIVWDSSPQPPVRHLGERDNNSICVANSCIKGGADGVQLLGNTNFSWLQGNISDDPLVRIGDPDRGHLREDSPAIDAGRSRFIWLGDTLFDYSDGEYVGEAPDMGFRESNFNMVEPGDYLPVTPLLIDAWPNPFNSVVNVGWQMPLPGAARLVVYDMQGKLVTQINEDQYGTGSYRATWNAADLAAGSYFLKLSTGKASVSRAIVLVK